jgi:hypothetical protein
MARRKGLGAILVVVLFLALILSIMATAFVNFQVNDKRLTAVDLNSQKAFYMADSGVEFALAKITRDVNWQGQNRLDPGTDLGPYEETVYVEGTLKYSFTVTSEYHYTSNELITYRVRSTGVVVDTSYTPPRLVAARTIRGNIQCTNDYNVSHDGLTGYRYTKVMEGTPGILWLYYDEFK